MATSPGNRVKSAPHLGVWSEGGDVTRGIANQDAGRRWGPPAPFARRAIRGAARAGLVLALLSAASLAHARAPSLVESGLLVAARYEGWSRSEVLAERARLLDTRPSLGGPIALLAVGGGLLTFAASNLMPYFAAGARAQAISEGRVALYNVIVGTLGAMALTGTGLALLGGLRLYHRIATRRETDAALSELDALAPAAPEPPPVQAPLPADAPSVRRDATPSSNAPFARL